MQSKKDIEEKFELEKWRRIADSIEAKSGHKYPSAALQKKFKELSKRGNAMESLFGIGSTNCRSIGNEVEIHGQGYHKLHTPPKRN